MLVVGLMSGTSLDGIDAGLVEVHGAGDWLRHSLRAFITVPWPAGLRERLVPLVNGQPTTIADVATVDVALGEALAAAAVEVCARAGVALADLDLIGSMGRRSITRHTAWSPFRFSWASQR